MSFQPKYAVYDQVEVLGDGNGHFGHGYAPGTLVWLTRFDGTDDSWACQTQEQRDLGPSHYHWVAQKDMRAVAPSEAEVAALFGLQATPHCSTCTCHQP